MGIKKVIIHFILSFVNFFVSKRPIVSNRISFITLESNVLESDLLRIYNRLDKEKYDIKTVLIHFDKNNLWTNFLYMLNCIKQIRIINTSKVVIINDNNYVISHFKREGVQVIQVWHATGAIKKFGNVVQREYPIHNYDYVLANSEYWVKPYSQAFDVKEENIMITGMPRVDKLSQEDYKERIKEKMYEKYPQLKDKKILLYAPTFRGNIYKGFYSVSIDMKKIVQSLDDNTVILYKYHPLLNATLEEDPRIINMNHENTHHLFIISDALISDYSSIIFDYSLLLKPMYYYVPDLYEYQNTLGCFVDYEKEMVGPICFNEEELIDALHQPYNYDIQSFQKTFFTYTDGHNIERVIAFIEKLL